MATYTRGICEKFPEDGKESSIFCDKCKSWVLPKSNVLNFIDFQLVNGSDHAWFCVNSNVRQQIIQRQNCPNFLIQYCKK